MSTSTGPSPTVARLGLPEQIRACLFDLDGVLVATAHLHEQAWSMMFDEFLASQNPGQPFDRFTDSDFDDYVNGRLRAEGTKAFLDSRKITLPEGAPDDAPGTPTIRGLSARKNELLLGLIRDGGVRSYPGSVRYLRAARAAGLLCTVVSSSANARTVLDAASLSDLIEVGVDGQTAGRDHLAGKPAPDTFLAGARHLNVEPDEAAVFEDALAGVAAGRAGAFGFVIGVDRGGDAEGLRSNGADIVVDDLSELLH